LYTQKGCPFPKRNLTDDGTYFLRMKLQYTDYAIIIPAHNEEAFLTDTLESVSKQTLPASRVVVVNDHSTDGTEAIIDAFAAKNKAFKKVNKSSSELHLPGSKVINAFNAGLQEVRWNFDFIVKLDADVILPVHYFERIAEIFSQNPTTGIAGGFIYEKSAEGEWLLNHPMDKDHVRGAIKAYTRDCFRAIGGLRNAMGWDTIDELLARYHGFDLYTEPSLHVMHQRPIGGSYSREARFMQGSAMYQMGYGFRISAIASLKMALMKKSPMVFIDNMRGFLKAAKAGMPYLAGREEIAFIRRYRWRKIREKLF
jgi:glycosyltransferase involved in cell wall biosynthesis